MSTSWPELNYAEAKATYQTLHLFTQIAGKIKLVKSPWVNHSWHVTLLVSPTGLTTGNIGNGKLSFQIDFDLVAHQLRVSCSTGQAVAFPLAGLSVAGFYRRLMEALTQLHLETKINLTPNELENPIPFDQDEIHKTYVPGHAENLHKALLKTNQVLNQFRTGFSGKCSPVHFFWGSFDLAVSRFSGKTAPPHPGGIPNLPDWVAREAYSHEVSSVGFWPGNEALPQAAFYAYHYPEPGGYSKAAVQPAGAYYHQTLHEFILPYDAVQKTENPEETLLQFLESTYAAGANLAAWNRAALETPLPAEAPNAAR